MTDDDFYSSGDFDDDFDEFGNDFGEDLSVGNERIEDFADDEAPKRSREQFLAEVDRNIQIVKSPKKFSAADRVKAAKWLGNSGEFSAIEPLILVYKKDKKNKNVREAAAHALGQFKAIEKHVKRKPGQSFEDAIYNDENQHILNRLADIMGDPDYGQTGFLTAKNIQRVLIGLTISFVLFAVLAVVMPSPPQPTQYTERFEAMTGTPGEIAVQQLEILMADARRDAETIQRQVNSGNLICSTEFANPIAYTLPENAGDDDSRIGDLVAQYNMAYSNLTLAKVEYDRVCASENPTISGTQKQSALTGVQTALDTLDSADALLVDVRSVIDANSAAATATADANLTATAEASITPTLTPTLTPTPGLPLQALNEEASKLFFTIGESQDAVDELESNWQNVKDFGESRGCTRPSPVIRDDYEIPEGYAEIQPDLKVAADLVNTGLALLRDGWTAFENACEAGTLTTLADVGLAAAETTRNTFTTAEDILNDLTGR